MKTQDFLVKILITSLAVMICEWLLSGVRIDGYWWAVVVALVLSLLNRFVKPFLILITIPATILTLGLFLLAINAIIILIADWIIESEFQVDGFWWALAFSFLLSIVTSILEGFDNKNKGNGRSGIRIEINK